MKNIVLIGFMGTGKTAVGRRLAAKLGRRFVDTDAAIEEVTGKTVAQIFNRDGVTRFRSEEAIMAEKLSRQEDLVISTGGGMVLNPENVRLLSETGVLIALTTSPEVIHQRVKNKKSRPMLQKGELRERIEDLLEERAGLYDVAEYTVDTSNTGIDQTVDQIIGFLKERRYL